MYHIDLINIDSMQGHSTQQRQATFTSCNTIYELELKQLA